LFGLPQHSVMISQKDYYTAPSQKIFDDFKKAAIMVWVLYDDTYGYATEKINYISRLENISDNYAVIVGMFDIFNQTLMLKNLKLKKSRELFMNLII
jgi:hypothetical protein